MICCRWTTAWLLQSTLVVRRRSLSTTFRLMTEWFEKCVCVSGFCGAGTNTLDTSRLQIPHPVNSSSYGLKQMIRSIHKLHAQNDKNVKTKKLLQMLFSSIIPWPSSKRERSSFRNIFTWQCLRWGNSPAHTKLLNRTRHTRRALHKKRKHNRR